MAAVRAIIKNDLDQVLAVRRARADKFGGQWEYAGGKVDPEETKVEALIREVKEETGLDVRPISFAGKTKDTWYYNCERIDPDQEIILSKEHSAYKWISI
jgi:mutator protein MutT